MAKRTTKELISLTQRMHDELGASLKKADDSLERIRQIGIESDKAYERFQDELKSNDHSHS